MLLPTVVDGMFRDPMPHHEKNWVPFIHDDSIHFFYSINPPVVLRMIADLPDDELGADIRTEFVSAAGNASVRWPWGFMSGGTPAVYDATLGGYIALFHSWFNHESERTGDPFRCYYVMGLCVFAAQPPFSIQLMTHAPLVGRDFYDESKENTVNKRIIFPVGLIVLSDAYLVSYGKDDKSMRVARFDRRKLLDSLQPPLPDNWEEPPC
jgi:hypothetical protein